MTDLVGDVGEHDDDVNVALEDHLPEVGHRLRERTLTGNVEPLLVADSRRNVAGVDVAALVVLKKTCCYTNNRPRGGSGSLCL